jgi:hypothetical protein
MGEERGQKDEQTRLWRPPAASLPAALKQATGGWNSCRAIAVARQARAADDSPGP